ncbi:MAG: protein-L-isoaspartate O-methyltransferase [bacterium]|nr:protein-L-isoaspartate O-methyltransferase [bacterium]
MALVDYLIKKGVLKNPKLISAFRVVDRKDFTPADIENFAYADEPLPIGEGQTISQPWTVAFMLELLNPGPGENILEIGYGSGWQTALLAYTGANVYAVERVPRLCKWGRGNVAKYKFKNVKFFCQDGTAGLPEVAEPIGGFDKIIAAAAAAPTGSVGAAINLLPDAWREQLKVGGKIVAPIGHSIFEFIKKSRAELSSVEHGGFAFVPLVSENG